MKERPILFSAAMVRAILAGTKTQTRRLVKPQPNVTEQRLRELGAWAEGFTLSEQVNAAYQSGFIAARCPYGQPGDRLWVREAFMHEPADYCWEASVSIPCRPAVTVYRADSDPNGEAKSAGWKPSIHMPRNLSRIDLEIVSVRVERLQDISEADAQAEGAPFELGELERLILGAKAKYRSGFCRLWQSINGRGSWDANPWVWVIEFAKI